MALTFHGNQFELGKAAILNWEVSCSKIRRPKTRKGSTKIISNDRGHVLPDLKQKLTYPGAGPWGRYVPTWQMPKKITRETAIDLQCPRYSEKKHKELVKEFEEKATAKADEETVTAKADEETATAKADEGGQEISKDECAGAESAPKNDPCANILDKSAKPIEDYPENDDNKQLDLTYVPGDLTDPLLRADNYELLRPKPELTLEKIRQQDMDYRKHQAEKHRHSKHDSPKINPFACVYRNFEQAKRCARENLEHHPLPDAVTHKYFKKLQMERSKEPGLGIDEVIKASGVGWKTYGPKGPTQCTKLNIYRPKTTAPKNLKHLDCRPGSCASFDMKWRFITQKDVTPIELAVCWDMEPENPTDEPKRTKHIDGSNGSAAPAVFQMVHSPKQPDFVLSRRASCDGIHGCGTEKSSSAGSHRSRSIPSIKNEDLRPKTSLPTYHNNLEKNLNTDNNFQDNKSNYSLYVNPPQTRISPKEVNKTYESLNKEKNNLINCNKLSKSSPNLSINSCSNNSCYQKNLNNNNYQYILKKDRCIGCNQMEAEKDRQKSEYKMAFKAGKYNENSIDSSSGNSSSTTKTFVKVPKQKDPYSKRNYDINSLHPPFSLWKGTSCNSYPEHWRLASVYQHSYNKPPEIRKKPLLASVYQ